MSDSAASESAVSASAGEGTSATQDASEVVKPKENGSAGASPRKPKYRHDWYQTPTDVYINIMIKGLKNDDVSVNFEEKMVC